MFDSLTSAAVTYLQTEEGIDGAVIDWSPPQNPDHGDLATSVALRIAKQVNKQPRAIADGLVKSLSGHPDVESVEVAGAGYVNVRLKPSAFLAEVQEIVNALEPTKEKKGVAPIIVDYSSPNIAKPLGIHHILSTVVGQTIVNMYAHAGVPVVRWNYLGDWGTQFGKLAVAFEKWGTKPVAECTLDDLLKLYVRFHDEAEKDASLEGAGQDAFRKLEEGDAGLRTFWEAVVDVTKAAMADIYARLNVSFDVERGESYYEDKMDAIVEEGKKKGVFKNGEKGATIVEFPEETNLPPAVVVKADGATLYLTRDLALMRDRMEGWHPEAILWAVDVAQQMYFKQLFDTVRQLEWDAPVLEHVYFGRMRFADGSMSTRKGKVLKLEEVLDEAVRRAEEIIAARGEAIQTDDPKELAEMMGVGALVYGILSQNRKMDMVFDWEKMLSFEGNSAPYLQYTYARAKSVLRKAGSEGDDAASPVETMTQHERRVFSHLLRFGAVLDEARTEKLPHKLANYLYELAQRFNAFYNSDDIVQASEPQRGLRLRLTSLTAAVLKAGASILTLRLPERM